MKSGHEKEFFNRIYLSELFDECNNSMISMAYLRFALSTNNINLVFYSAHAFLSHVGNISRLLWPNPKTRRRWPKSYERDKELKLLLNIPEDSPLKETLFRNNYENFEDRIDDWVFNSKHQNFVEKYIGPLDKIKGIDTGDIMKHFDPSTFVFKLRGDIYDFKSAENEIITLMKKIQELPLRPIVRVR